MISFQYGMNSFQSDFIWFQNGINSFQNVMNSFQSRKMIGTTKNWKLLNVIKWCYGIHVMANLVSITFKSVFLFFGCSNHFFILEWNHSRVISKIIINVNNFFIRKAREIIPSPINSQNKPRILRRGLDIKFQKHLEQIRSNMERNHSNMEWIHSKWNKFIPK